MNDELMREILNIENEADQLAAIYRHFKAPGRSINNTLIDTLVWAMRSTQQKVISTIDLAYVSGVPYDMVNAALRNFEPPTGWTKKPMGSGYDFVRKSDILSLVDVIRAAGYETPGVVRFVNAEFVNGVQAKIDELASKYDYFCVQNTGYEINMDVAEFVRQHITLPEGFEYIPSERAFEKIEKENEMNQTPIIPNNEIQSAYLKLIALGQPFTRYSVTMALRLQHGRMYDIPHQVVVDYIDQQLGVPAGWHEESMQWGNKPALTFVPGPAPEPEDYPDAYEWDSDDEDDWYEDDEEENDWYEDDEEYDFKGIITSAFNQLIALGQPFTRYSVTQLARSLNPAVEIDASLVRFYITEAPDGWTTEHRDYNGNTALTFVPVHKGYTILDMRNAVERCVFELCDTGHDFSINDVSITIRTEYKGVVVNASAVRKFAYDGIELPAGWVFDGEVFIAPAEEEDDFFNIQL